MRVTDRGRANQLILNNANAAARYDKASQVASNGAEITKPSDDPGTYGSMVRSNYSLKLMEERSKSATQAKNSLRVAEDSLTSGIDVLVSARETAIAAANGTADAASRKTAAEDIRNIRNELLTIANTRYGDRYVFGGSQTGSPPFDKTTGAFLGNDQQLNVPVLDGVAPPANISGSKTFTAASGGVDVFKALDDLATALDNNDAVAINAAIDPITKAHDQLVSSQVTAGFAADRFEQAVTILTATTTNVSQRIKDAVNGDPAKQLTELTLSQTAYQRSISVSAKILSISSLWSGSSG